MQKRLAGPLRKTFVSHKPPIKRSYWHLFSSYITALHTPTLALDSLNQRFFCWDTLPFALLHSAPFCHFSVKDG